MAGRVERRINNALYFVLDEVGGSDCESESPSESDAKTADILNRKGNMSNDNDKEGTFTPKNYILNNGMGDGNPGDEESSDFIMHDPNTSQESNYSNKSESKSFENMMSPSRDKDKSPILNTTTDNLGYEDISTVIDMNIDSDFEGTESKVEPLIRITFRDRNIGELLKSSLQKFLSQKITGCTIVTNSEDSLEFEVYDKDPDKLLQDDLIDFDLDTTPGDHYSDVPHYGKTYDFVLSDKSIEKIEEVPENGKAALPPITCFNCLGNHCLRECTEVKHFGTINRNRQKFEAENKLKNKNKRTKQGNTNSRYHLDNNQKFGHIIPGVISKKLRNALNLHHDQQPGFIYQMRVLGYPPAWLEEAKVSHSGVAMYDSKGVPVLEEDEEEGEIIPEGSKDKFDISKIIEFPGFNVPLPNNFKDESKKYKCPAMSDKQSKENLIKLLEPKTVQAYVKKSLNTQKSEENPGSQVESKRISSPTIEEMEEKKRQLLMELDDEDSASDTKLNSEDSSSGPGTESDNVQNNINREFGSVKNLEFGTPILKSVSPFSKLPSREQFSINVSDVINFENIPDSTGKYETLRNVLSKIRVTTSKTQSK